MKLAARKGGKSSRATSADAGLAEDVFIAHATPGGHLARLLPRLAGWGSPVNRCQAANLVI
jgi:hypothetical protein